MTTLTESDVEAVALAWLAGVGGQVARGWTLPWRFQRGEGRPRAAGA